MGIEALTEDELIELRACEKDSAKANNLAAALEAADQAENTANDRAEEAAQNAKPRFS